MIQTRPWGTCSRFPQPGRPAHLQQVLRTGRGCGSVTRSARRDFGPRLTRCASRSASTPSPRPPAPRRFCTKTTSAAGSRARSSERIRVEEGLAELGLRATPSQANFAWIELGEDRRGGGGRRPLAERQIAVRPGAALGDPGHIRASFGTGAENERLAGRARRSARLSGAQLLQLSDKVKAVCRDHELHRRPRRRARARPLHLLLAI